MYLWLGTDCCYWTVIFHYRSPLNLLGAAHSEGHVFRRNSLLRPSLQRASGCVSCPVWVTHSTSPSLDGIQGPGSPSHAAPGDCSGAVWQSSPSVKVKLFILQQRAIQGNASCDPSLYASDKTISCYWWCVCRVIGGVTQLLWGLEEQRQILLHRLPDGSEETGCDQDGFCLRVSSGLGADNPSCWYH